MWLYGVSLIEGHMNRSLYDRDRYLPVGSPTQALLPYRGRPPLVESSPVPVPRVNVHYSQFLSLFNSITQPFYTFLSKIEYKCNVWGSHVSCVSYSIERRSLPQKRGFILSILVQGAHLSFIYSK